MATSLGFFSRFSSFIVPSRFSLAIVGGGERRTEAIKGEEVGDEE